MCSLTGTAGIHADRFLGFRLRRLPESCRDPCPQKVPRPQQGETTTAKSQTASG